jgi:acetyl esterase/lipase
MRGDGEALAKALQAAGVDTDVRLYPVTHAFMIGVNAEHPESQRAIDDIARIVRHRLARGEQRQEPC